MLLSAEVTPDEETNPWFGVQTQGDQYLSAPGFFLNFSAVASSGSGASVLHVYSEGTTTHGYGLCSSNEGTDVCEWPLRMADWLALRGFVGESDLQRGKEALVRLISSKRSL